MYKVFHLFLLVCLPCLITCTRNFAQDTDVKLSVPAPWTALQIEETNQKVTVGCWGRKYVFDQSYLPSQIYSQDVPLLSRPMDIITSYKGTVLQFNPPSIKVISKTDESIDIATTVSSKNYQFGVISIGTQIHIEYDGLMLISLKTTYPTKFKPDSFAIEIPYNTNVSKYYIKGGPNSNANYSGGFSLKNGLLLASDFAPYFWIGDNYRGLFWFCESAQNWPDAQESTAIQIINQQNEVIQKFDLGSIDFYQFGIQATPVKSLLNNWRNLRFSPAIKSNVIIPWPKPGTTSSTKYFGWPEAVNDDNYTALINKYHQNGTLVLSYATITMLPGSSPFYQENKTKWIEGPKPMKLPTDSLIFIEPNSKNYKESIPQQLAYYLKKYNLDGYYLDGTKLYPYFNKGQIYYPILAYRELQKRLYDSVKSKNPNALIIAHMSSSMNIPVLSFVDGYVDGEQFRSASNGKQVYKVRESYLDVIDLDQFRAEFIGKQWGIVPFFLPEFDPASINSVQPTLGLVSLLLVHDVQPWPIFSNISIWNKMYEALDSFGFQNSTFVPYYSDTPPASANDLKGVYISAYKKTNQALIIVSNLSKNKISGKITLNISVLGLKNINDVYSFSDSAKADFNQNTISINLDPLSYKLFWVK
jgi:hypothetical protein